VLLGITGLKNRLANLRAFSEIHFSHVRGVIFMLSYKLPSSAWASCTRAVIRVKILCEHHEN
jgi:hypothetical protein